MANGPGGKSAGRVSIRVVPDTTRFKADLKKSLDRIEKSTVLNVPLAIETRQAEVDLRKFAKKWNGQALNFDVDAKTTGAAAHLKEFTRKRVVQLDVDIRKASLAKAAAILGSLSGARVTGDLVKNVGDSLLNLDRSLPKIAAVVLAIGSIGSVALSSLSGILTMIAGLSALAGLASPLPGLLGAMAASVVVLGVALSDAGDQLSSLQPVWANLKSIISDNFWDKAKQPIIDFVRGTLPQLQAGLGPVATALGSWTASIAAGFQKAFGGGVIEGMLGKLTESINIAASGTGSFANVIATLGTFGAQYLPRLAQYFADITAQFDTWVSKVAADGNLAQWVELGLNALHQLGQVLSATVQIFLGLENAALNAGGGGLATFASALQGIADIVNSAGFQTTLTTLFVGAGAGAQGLATALAPIGAMLAALAPTLATVLSSIGVTLGTVVGQIASAFSSPAVADGILALFQGLRDGIVAIQPALPAVAAALGSVATFAGALAAQLGPILGASLAELAPVVTGLLSALQPLIPVLGSVLLQAIAALAPFVQMLVGVIAQLVPAIQPVIAAFGPLVGALMPTLNALFQALLPIISTVVPVIAQLAAALFPIVEALLPVLNELLVALSPIISLVATVFAQIAAALLPIVSALLPPLNALFTALMPIVLAVVQAVLALLTPILQLLSPLLQLIGPILGPLIGLLAGLATLVANTVVPIIQTLTPIFAAVGQVIGDIMLPVIKLLTDVLGGLITFLTGVFTGNWKQAWDGIVQIFSGIWDGIIGIGKATINGVVDIINGLIGSVNNITGAIGIPKIPKIPRLALGADIEPTIGGTAVVLGEGGRKETVTDYGRTNALIEAANGLASRALASAGSGDVNVRVVNKSGAALSDLIELYIEQGDKERRISLENRRRK